MPPAGYTGQTGWTIPNSKKTQTPKTPSERVVEYPENVFLATRFSSILTDSGRHETVSAFAPKHQSVN